MEANELISYLQGQGTDEERRAIETWLAADPANQAQLDKLKRLTALIQESDLIKAPDIDLAWQKVQTRIESPVKRRWNPMYVWTGIAASILILMLAYFSKSNIPQTDWITISRNDQTALTKHTLPDGSTVWLKENSTLRHPEGFGDSERKVQLDGEGFFEVFRDEDRPFIIESGATFTEVLGTSFDLMTFPDSQQSWVHVKSGKVAFYRKDNGQEKLVLEAGQKGVYNKETGTLVKAKTVDANRMAWKTHELTFIDTPMREVISLLSSLYQKEIELCPPSLGDQRLNAQFKQERLDSILESISILFELQQTNLSKNEIILNTADCQK